MQLPFVHPPMPQSLLHAQCADALRGGVLAHFVPVPQALDEQSVCTSSAAESGGVVLMHPPRDPPKSLRTNNSRARAVTATPANIRFHAVDHASMRLSIFAYNRERTTRAEAAASG